MMRSLYSGISGLRNHQTRMDVIGNNIANVNTAGYKTSRVIFQDIFSQNMQGGMGSQPNIGGVNPNQVGLGIRLSSIDVLHTRSAFQRTDKETDMMINGDGFFIVRQFEEDGVTLKDEYYTRAGNFDIDSDGYLVNSEGLFVMGYLYPLQALVYVTVQGGAEVVTDYDPTAEPPQGGTWKPAFSETAPDPGPPPVPLRPPSSGEPYIGEGYPIPQPGNAYDNYAEDGYTYTIPPGLFDALSNGTAKPVWIKDRDDRLGAGDGWQDEDLQKIRLKIPAGSTTPGVVGGALNDDPLDDYPLTGISIGKNGDISVMVGATKYQIATVAIAMFSNPAGLDKAGNSLYQVSSASGPTLYTESYMDGAGNIDSGGLEMSNVDLSSEFTDMIVTQRGFQANSRIITVSDSLLEELVNLKR